MNIIAIDCGASFTKGALFQDGELINTISKQTPEVNRSEDIFDKTHITALLDNVREMITGLTRDVQSAKLCISNEMHGFILTENDGTPYTGYLSWQRELMPVKDVMGVLSEKLGEELLQESVMRTGMPLRSGLPSSNLTWMEYAGTVDQGKTLRFYTLGDYLVKALTGVEPICHPTNAAATGLYDVLEGKWNEEYIRAICGEHIIFPKIGTGEISCFIGKTACEVLPAIGDQQAALLGSGFRSEGMLSFNMGTGAQVSRLVTKPELGAFQVRPYFYGTYLRTIPHIPSGRALNVFFRFVKDIVSKVVSDVSDEKVWEIMQESVTSGGHKADMACDLSFFENAVTSNRKGSICNIGEKDLTLEGLMTSVIDQMADNFSSLAIKVNEGLAPVESIVFSGGISKRWPVLRDEIVNRMDVTVPVTVSENDTLYGCYVYGEMI